VEMFKEDYGEHSLDEFGSHSYQGSLTSIMFDYWRSYLSVKYLIPRASEWRYKTGF